MQQIRFKPVAGFEIKMVGRFVEQQQVRLRQQQLGQRDTHLPTAGKLSRVSCPVFLAKAEAIEHRANLRVERVTVMHAKVAQYALIAFGDLVIFTRSRIEFAHLVGELFHLHFQRLQPTEHGHTFFEDGAAFETQAILRQIAEGSVFCRRDGAVVERLDAAQDFQQCGFAGTVGAHQSHAVVGRDEPIQIVEQKFGAEPFSG